jgi:hypothetical protein
MPSSDDLIQHVYAYLLQAYHQAATGGSGGEIVAFEPMGFSPGCIAAPGPGIAAAALEEVSQLADVVPQVDGGVYTHTGRTITVQYASIVDAAQPSSAASIAVFSDLKSQAGKLYRDAASDGELDGPKATYATPADWYDLNNAGNWASYSYNSSIRIPEPPPSWPKVAPNVHLAWRVVPEQLRPLYFRRPVELTRMAAAPSVPVQAARMRPAPARPELMAAESMSTRMVSVAATDRVERAAPVHTMDYLSRASIAQLVAQTVPQPVETTTFRISFDYCLVRLRRPWLSGDFLNTPGWYVPGAQGGDYATGGPANAGWFAALPTAFIAIKKLVIGGSWSANDAAAAGNSTGLGPFSFMGTTANSQGVLSNAGVQIIAWICDMQPKLPPDSDPTLAPAAPTPAAPTPAA